MTLTEIEKYLTLVNVRPNDPTPEEVEKALGDLKRIAVDRQDESCAKRVWCLEQAHAAQTRYLRAFDHMKCARFYEAWCDLEGSELALQFLAPHSDGLPSEFRLDFIEEYIRKWQALFPYKVFLSPEMIEEEVVCSICNTRVMPRSPCGHIVGEVYRGEMCCRIVTKMHPLGVAMVKNPVQKYSVVFTCDPVTGKERDHYNYGLVQYAIRALRAGFDRWDAEWTTRRQPHSYFRHVGQNDPCPCDSEKKYKKCCLEHEGVLRPHVEFTFSIPPPGGTPTRGFVE
jgi:hypothetical protein